MRRITRLETLNFQIERFRKTLHPVTGAASRQIGMPLLQGFTDIAQRGARQGDQAIKRNFVQHLTSHFRPAAHTRCKLRPREKLAEL